MGLHNELCLLSLLLTITGVYGGQYCYKRNSVFEFPRWCTNGCCGDFDSECCDSNIALIVGLTVGGILVVAGIITIVCFYKRRRAAAGKVIGTGAMGPGAIVVKSSNTSNMTSMGQPMAYPPDIYAPQAYPMGQQPIPAQPYGATPAQPNAAALSPPPYSQATGQDNSAYTPPVQ